MNKFRIPAPIRYSINAALVAAFLLIGNAIMSSGIIGRAQSAVVIQVAIYMILAVSLNVATGYLGQLPLGHAGFMAVGAYAGALFWKSGFLSGVPDMIAGLIAAGVAAAFFGILIGIPALRLRGDYLAIITLGFGEIIRVAIINLPSITGGTPGLRNIPKYSSFLLVYSCVALTCTFIHMMMKSRHGRAILSLRENEIAAESCGVNTTYYKVLAFSVSAFFAGVAGALYGGMLGILVPGNFDFMASIHILVMVVLGGMGSMLGSILAAAILTALPLALQSLNEYRMILYSILLIGVMIFKPSGLMGTYDFSMAYVLEKLGGRLSANGKGRLSA
ncbi:MAG: branched-chain amino acid ABC transporter permease [Clostridiales bacterium]|nr:branched-chain amino acid ABC transporter permease [Clostridiales bacterium]